MFTRSYADSLLCMLYFDHYLTFRHLPENGRTKTVHLIVASKYRIKINRFAVVIYHLHLQFYDSIHYGLSIYSPNRWVITLLMPIECDILRTWICISNS